MQMLCIVQARCSSSRLPGKVIKNIAGKPMIIHELERLTRSRFIDKIVVATSIENSDDYLAEIVTAAGFSVFRGNLEDVLDRYYRCAQKYKAQHVVRITGDCPVIDWRIVDFAIKNHLEHGNDYTKLSDDYPDGLDTEVITFSAMEEAWQRAVLLSEREHVTLYLRNCAERYRIEILPCPQNLGAMRWTVDEDQDFMFISKIFSELYEENRDFGMKDILSLLKEKPQLIKINQGIKRNEGLIKSLANDRKI